MMDFLEPGYGGVPGLFDSAREVWTLNNSSAPYIWEPAEAIIDSTNNNISWPSSVSSNVLSADMFFGSGSVPSSVSSNTTALNGLPSVGLDPGVLTLSTALNVRALIMVLNVRGTYRGQNTNPIHPLIGGRSAILERDYAFQHFTSSYDISVDGGEGGDDVREFAQASMTGQPLSPPGQNFELLNYSHPPYTTDFNTFGNSYGIEVFYMQISNNESLSTELIGGLVATDEFRAVANYGEILIWDNTIPSQTEIDKTLGLLTNKYSIRNKLPANHPYRNSPPIV